MKTTLKTVVFLVALVVMSGCSAQKRAERRVRRAVNECPELVQLKAHPIEGTVTAPAFADMALLPLAPVLSYDTLYASTDHGTVVVSLRPSDSALRVGFVAAPREVRYRDTVRYAQVVLPSDQAASRKGSDFFGDFIVGFLCVAAGFAITAYLILIKKN